MSPVLDANKWQSWDLSPGLFAFPTTELGGLPFGLQITNSILAVPFQVTLCHLVPLTLVVHLQKSHRNSIYVVL